jgi:hypothetical protein
MNNRPQKTEVYKCDICEEEFESEQELKEHAEDCACSETGNEEDEAENEAEADDENDGDMPPLTGEESAEETDEEDNQRAQKNVSDRNRSKGQKKLKK